MSSPLKTRITDDVKTAMKAGDKERLGCLRLITAALKQREVDERIELDDAAVLQILGKMVKQRRDSITQFNAGNRADLAAKEAFEISIIESYLPQALSDAELTAILDAALLETGATSGKDMGRVMTIIKARVQGRADMGEMSARIKARLGG
jgi:hypothetical protein